VIVNDTDSVIEYKDSGFGAINDAFEWGRLKLDNRSTNKVKTDSERMMDDLFGADTEDTEEPDQPESSDSDKDHTPKGKKAEGESGSTDHDDVELDYDNQ